MQGNKSDLGQIQEAVELRNPDDTQADEGGLVDTKLSETFKASFSESEASLKKRSRTYPRDIVSTEDADNSSDSASVTPDNDGDDSEKKEDMEDVKEGQSAGALARDHGKDYYRLVAIVSRWLHNAHKSWDSVTSQVVGICCTCPGGGSSESECKRSLCQAIPLLVDLYGKAMHKILHIGRGSCGIVHELLKEDHIEVWGLEPEEIKTPAGSTCDNFIKKGRIRVSEPGRPLHYRPKSFSLILVSDVLDKLTPGILRAALKEYERATTRNLIVVVGKSFSLQSHLPLHMLLLLSNCLRVRKHCCLPATACAPKSLH